MSRLSRSLPNTSAYCIISSFPLPSGTPITLLPHGVPAYYLNTYAGPTSALTSQFEEALLGWGAGGWKIATSQQQAPNSTSATDTSTYIIAWLSVQNKQGEDKGIPIIWPVGLCLAYHPGSPSSHSRTPLQHIPDLPSQLQASPPSAPPTLPASLAVSSSSRSRSSTPLRHTQPLLQEHEHLTGSVSRRPRTLTSSPTSETMRAFRALTLARQSARDINKVAAEVSGYVDAVAKERERERERLKREREGRDAGGRGRTSSTSGPPPNATAVPSEPVPVPIPPEPMAEPVAPPTTEVVPDMMDTHPIHMSREMSRESTDSLFSPPDMPMDLAPVDDPLQMTTDIEPPPQASTSTVTTGLPALSTGPNPGGMSSFDPFGSFDAPWGEANEFMNMEYDMGFGMNIDSIGDARMGGGGGGSFDMDDGFGVFTDDDFSFFDGPAAHSRTMAPPPSIVNSRTSIGGGPTQAIVPVSALTPAGEGIHLSGPGPPSLPPGQSSPWTAQPLADAFDLRSTDPHSLGDGGVPPDLLPLTPTKTSLSSSSPTTPAVQLSDQNEFAGDRKSTQLTLCPSIFDPIPFAPSHRAADGKYVVGKFALPSPPDEEDCTEPMVFAPARGWRLKYSAATDPRIGLVRKLIGVKRKSFDQGVRTMRMSPAWVREHEEWESSTPSPAEDAQSEADSDEEPWVEEDDAAAASRPSTPVPAYLPVGPTLLQTHFYHSCLLPLSTPLRPPGAAVNNLTSGAAPMSVPTPVSPAAVLGAASEKAKSLEAAAHMLVKELVENTLWADAWRANSAAALAATTPPTEVWQTDVKRVGRALASVGEAQSPVNIQTLCAPDQAEDLVGSSTVSLQLLEPPMLSVGKSDAAIHVLPPALRFWEKLGLGPRPGRKNVTAYVFYEETTDERAATLKQWLDKVSAVYSSKNFGTHITGASKQTPGLVPVRFDSLRKTLSNFASTLPSSENHVVFYIVSPDSIITFASPVLRQLFSAVKRVVKTHPDLQILYHFVPESLTTGNSTDPRSHYAGLDTLVENVYDRVLQPVERSMSRRFPGQEARTLAHFQAPAFTLAHVLPSPSHGQASRVTFVLEPHASTLDVIDRHTLLHVGYQVTSCGRWLVAACIDARGEAHDLGTWITPGESLETFVVTKVWDFVRAFASRANVEWRVVIAKLGSMGGSELDAWVAHLEKHVSLSDAVPPWQVTLLAVEHENPWTFLAPRPSPSSHRHSSPPSTTSSSRGAPRVHSNAIFSDTSSATYALFHSGAPPYIPSLTAVPGAVCPGATDLPFIPDCEDELPTQQRHPYIFARGASTLVFVPAGTDYTSVSTVHIFRLHSARMLRSTYGKRRHTAAEKQPVGVDADVDQNWEDEETLRDITLNFHDLAVLGRARWKLRPRTALPFHLAALEVMRVALGGESGD
ncbi:mediator complex subunit 13 C-terminal-domain-containing protein [Amylocystis lapponica]|nr:mediator complex subunit 13 C-terminal-domain-containing protein [Amylocystis lapponica]